MARRKSRYPLTIIAEWEPTAGADRLWKEAIDLLAEGLADLAIADARREVEEELARERASVHDAPQPMADRSKGRDRTGAIPAAMAAPWFRQFVAERDLYSFREHSARLGVPVWVLRESLKRAGFTKSRPDRTSPPPAPTTSALPPTTMSSSPVPPTPTPARTPEHESRPRGRTYDIVATRHGEPRKFGVTLHADDDEPDGIGKARRLIEQRENGPWIVQMIRQRE